MKCWICGNAGKPGEHLPKASDIKGIFRRASQKTPLFFSTDLRRNVKIGSIKRSQNLKSKAPICAYCNNVRTAPHDRAWEKLSKYLREKKSSIKDGEIVKLNRVFPGSTKKSMLDASRWTKVLMTASLRSENLALRIENDLGDIFRATLYPNSLISKIKSMCVATPLSNG